MTTALSKLARGARGRILSLGAAGPMKRRLMDMGVVPGEEIKVEKVAPLGDPLEVTVKGYSLSLRKAEAEGIAVEVLP